MCILKINLHSPGKYKSAPSICSRPSTTPRLMPLHWQWKCLAHAIQISSPMQNCIIKNYSYIYINYLKRKSKEKKHICKKKKKNPAFKNKLDPIAEVMQGTSSYSRMQRMTYKTIYISKQINRSKNRKKWNIKKTKAVPHCLGETADDNVNNYLSLFLM